MPRRYRLIAIAGALIVAAGSAAVASASADDRTELCGRYDAARVKASRYLVMNNVWGATTGQCIEVSEDGSFRVARTEHRKTDDAAAAYPSIYAGCHWGRCTHGTNLPLRVDQIRQASSSWESHTEAPGIWNATYDLWFHTTTDMNTSPDGAELMIWLDSAGGANPSGSVVARNVRLAGTTWDLWYADSTWNYLAYVRTTPTSAVRDLNLREFIADAVARGYVQSSWYLSAVEAGFEIWRDGAGLESTSFAVRTAGNTAAPPPVLATEAAPPSPTSSARLAPPSPVRSGCTVRWSSNSWNSGLVASVVVTNHGPPLSGWTMGWRFRSDERVVNDWGVEIDQDGRSVSARNAPYNAALGRGASARFGFQADHGGSPAKPAEFRLNGVRCD